MHAYIRTYIHMYIVCICMHVYIYIYIYIYLQCGYMDPLGIVRQKNRSQVPSKFCAACVGPQGAAGWDGGGMAG